jgi:DNA-binding NarL/FixJ family response regulator
MARVAIIGSARCCCFASRQNLTSHELVARFSSAKAALRKLQADQFDVLVVQLELPDIHGLELIRMLRVSGQLGAFKPVLVRSSLNSALNIYRVSCSGVSGLLLMGDSAIPLVWTIDTILQGNIVFPSFSQEEVERSEQFHCARKFTARQVAVLYGLSNGLSVRKIAKLLSVSAASVFHFRAKVICKLQVESQERMIQVCREIGLI